MLARECNVIKVLDGFRAPAFAILLTVSLVGAVAGYGLYARPQAGEIRRADAIVILGGYGVDRYRIGFKLAREGWAPAVVLSEIDGDGWVAHQCRKEREGFEVVCITPNPPTTLGEARALDRLARERDWSSVIIVTFRPHISRARHTFDKCFTGDIYVVESPATISIGRWIYEYAYQSFGYLKNFVLYPNC